ncbi:ABC transporter substrate-binding protein [Pseudoalteromonas shioyasakiensis]|uniref:ABC transporter substrate-binding protein n=1 Tax=Pseudoalteromonas shioyasakiensis TaxID=1190813 RepID=UPI0021189054|nr:ABC transporter substrate-binding protein [Pseudoalteromonas shioyasakiensis]MCQ8879083.1 ABC transporter substrate-binding protein [Pseudoalteromonas shioyasakiensis]
MLIISFSSSSQNIEEITWLYSDTAPFHLAKSEQSPDGGLCDYLTEQLIKELPQIKHTRLQIPNQRITKYLTEGHKACHPCMIHRKNSTPRAKYSIPTTVYPPFSIITTTANAKKISQLHGPTVRLISLLTDSSFIFGKSAARKFTNEINTVAQNTGINSKASLSWSSENESRAVISRLNHGYIDYSIDYPFVADYYNRNTKLNNVVTLSIDSPREKFVLGAVGCSATAPNDFAKKALKIINDRLEQNILPSEKYQESQRKWLKNTFTDFDQYYQQQILQPIAQPSSVQQEADQPSGAGR